MGGSRLQHQRNSLKEYTGGRWIRLPLVFALILQVSVAFGHPDLLLQIEALDEQIASDPENAELLGKRGDLHRRYQNFADAADDFNSARNADPGFVLIDFLAGKLMLDIGKPEAAEQMLSRYLESQPDHAFAWVLRGRAFIRLGQAKAAANDFTEAISASQRPSPEIFRLQILSLAAQGSDHAAAALAAVDAGLERFSVEFSLLGYGVDIALSQGKAEIAQGYLEHVPAALHSLPQWQNRLETVNCLGTPASPGFQDCLTSARSNLDAQLRQFMADT